MTEIKNLKNLLKKHDIRPLRKMGQNFLLDNGILKKIIDAAELNSGDIVLEIGPGLGILTLELARKVKRVVAVEKDRKIYEILENILKGKNIKNVEIINQDILKIPDVQLYRDRDKVGNYKIIANLPYYITSPIIRKFLEIKNKPSLMVLMLQKEVAQRICAQSPKMNLLAVAIQFYAEPKIIGYVNKKSFYPQPKVDSAIIRIIPKKEIPKIDTEKFFKIVKAGFSSKRKMLKNNLSGINFEKTGLSPKIRAENLSINEWLKIYEII